MLWPCLLRTTPSTKGKWATGLICCIATAMSHPFCKFSERGCHNGYYRAALAMLTVGGLLGYRLIQRQVRLYLYIQDQQIPGNKRATAPQRLRWWWPYLLRSLACSSG